MGITERREREKEQRRNIIIDAAERTFIEKGFINSTMEDVAEAAELGKGTLYLYFKSKTELYYAILLRFMNGLKAELTEISRRDKCGLDKLEELGRVSYEFFMNEPNNIKSLICSDGIDAAMSSDGEYTRRCYETDRQLLEVVAGVIRTGIEDGSIRRDIDPDKNAVVIYKVLMGIMKITSVKISTEKTENPECHGVAMEEVFSLTLNMIKESMKSR